MALGNYSKRSSIPTKLVMNIMKQIFQKIGVVANE